MRKDQNLTGQPIFAQILGLIHRSDVARQAAAHQSNRYYKQFTTYGHLVTMLYAIFHKCTSLREVTTGMQACLHRLNHLGLGYCPRRSTLSDANKRRPSSVFQALYEDLYKRYRSTLPDSRKKTPRWHRNLYIIDSTTVTLFKEILKNAGRTPINGKRKGGIKVHTLMKAEEDVPCLVKMTAAASHDVPFIKNLNLPKGSYVTFDKGYVDYSQYDLWTRSGIYWITRLRKGAQYQIGQPRPVSKRQRKLGVISDSHITLGHESHDQVTRTPARLIHYCDKQSGKEFQFITNNFLLSPATIARIYKHRWQIEILYKRLKQNYPLQYFLGDNENAIRIQIWCALIADLLLKVIQGSLRRKWSFGNLSSMVRIHLMSYTNLALFLENPDRYLINSARVMNRGPTLFTQGG